MFIVVQWILIGSIVALGTILVIGLLQNEKWEAEQLRALEDEENV